MAEHKVPQDVEADDKLIGPFSFRQFIYLMIAFGGCVMAFFLSQASPVLAIIPAPMVLFFGVLALPLRKDQPMEVYLAALIKYYFGGSRVRIWAADGEEPNVTISAPETVEDPKTKELAADEVSRRLSFLANITDTQGWSTRGFSASMNQTNLNDDYASAAQDAYDVMDDSNTVQVDNMLTKSAQDVRSRAMAKMREASQLTNATSQTAPVYTQPVQSSVLASTPSTEPSDYWTTPLQTAQLPNYAYQNTASYQSQYIPQAPAQPIAPVQQPIQQPIPQTTWQTAQPSSAPVQYMPPTTPQQSPNFTASKSDDENVITDELLRKVAMHRDDDVQIDRNTKVINPNGDESAIIDNNKDEPNGQTTIGASDGSFIDIKFH